MIDDSYEIAQNLKVSDLLSYNSRTWDEEKILGMFSERDARAILSTRIPQYDTDDRTTWVNNNHYKKNSYQRPNLSATAIPSLILINSDRLPRRRIP